MTYLIHSEITHVYCFGKSGKSSRLFQIRNDSVLDLYIKYSLKSVLGTLGESVGMAQILYLHNGLGIRTLFLDRGDMINSNGTHCFFTPRNTDIMHECCNYISGEL